MSRNVSAPNASQGSSGISGITALRLYVQADGDGGYSIGSNKDKQGGSFTIDGDGGYRLLLGDTSGTARITRYGIAVRIL